MMENIKICINCSKEIIAEGRNKFCSAECQNTYFGVVNAVVEDAVKEKVQKSEENTKKSERNVSKYKEKARKSVENVSKPEKKCINCGKVILKEKNARKFCDSVCLQTYSRNKIAEAKAKITYPEAICEYCGKAFPKIRGDKKFCSTICQSTNQNKNAKANKVKVKVKKIKVEKVKESVVYSNGICIHCGKEFAKTRPNKKFCSNVCSLKFNYQQKAKPMVTYSVDICGNCGKEFTKTRYNKKYCSESCIAEAAYKRKRPSNHVGVYHRVCLFCGKEFDTTNGKKVFCAEKCFRTHQRSKRPKIVSPGRILSCNHCGKEFTTKYSRKKYCSQECSYTARGIKHNSSGQQPRLCEYCGKEFTTTYSHKKYCSKECANSAWGTKHNSRWQSTKQPRLCGYCGKEFSTTHSHKKYCSQECSSNAKYTKKPKVKITKLCDTCGKEFETMNTKNKFCHINCKTKYYRIRIKNQEVIKKINRKPKTTNIEATCLHCGETFIKSNYNKKYCSNVCLRRGNYNQKMEAKKEIKKEINIYNRDCMYCGKNFDTTTKKKVYCSNECAYNHYRIKKSHPKPETTKHCAYCGNEFKTKYNNAIYCQKKCSIKAGKTKLRTIRLQEQETLNHEVVNQEVMNHEVVNHEVVNQEVMNHEVVNQEVMNHEVMNKNKKILVISAPSGGGKSIVAEYILSNFNKFSFSISSTTRSIREGEKDSENYYFLDKYAFLNKINNNEFVEYEEFFGNYYGTMVSEIERIFSLDKIPLLDIDVKGAFSIKKRYGDDALLLFLKPPNMDVLKQRLMDRNTETTEQLENRIARAEMEIEMSKDFDSILVNDNLDILLSEVKELITKNFVY